MARRARKHGSRPTASSGSIAGHAGTKQLPVGFNVAVLAASLWFFGGLLLDGWAHNHLDLSAEGFFTPYHAVFYSGFAALAAVLGLAAWRNHVPGRPWREAFPQGYGMMALGIGIFAAGGFLDMLWHVAFGIEQDVQALFSPTHLLLAAGGATMMSGPIRAGLSRPADRTWRARFPELLALAFFATLVTFFLMWAFSTGAAVRDDPHRVYAGLRGNALDDFRDLQIQNGIAAVIFRSLVMAGVAGFAARRMVLPFGAIAMLVTVPNVLIETMLNPAPVPLAIAFVSALAAGLGGDVALRRIRVDRASWATRAFAFGLPFVFWAVYLSLADVSSHGFWWSPHVAFGAPVIGGFAGLLLELAGETPRPRSSL